MRTDLILDFHERFKLEQSVKASKREHERAEQSSPLNSPDVRIRHWERLHRLSLPRNPLHPVLNVIAVATGLTVADVRTHQYQRFVGEACLPRIKL